MSLSALLEFEGHDVRTTFEAISAETVAAEFRPEIAFLDLGLPSVNGFELARRLRGQPGMNGMVLVAVTGWGKDEDRQRSRDAGFDLHMVKPVEPDQILDEVRKVPRGARHAALLQACVSTRIRLSRFKSSASGLKGPIF